MLSPDSTNTLFLVCDLQSLFRPVIHGFESVVATTNKMLKIAKVLGIEVIVTTQKAKALGDTDPAVDLSSLGALHVATIDKTLFSMITPEVLAILKSKPAVKNVVLLGIETQVCILQTALDLLALGNYTPLVLADATSSTNVLEIEPAHHLLRQQGAVVITSAALSFLLIKDASLPVFKPYNEIVKEEKANSSRALEVLLGFQKHKM